MHDTIDKSASSFEDVELWIHRGEQHAVSLVTHTPHEMREYSPQARTDDDLLGGHGCERVGVGVYVEREGGEEGGSGGFEEGCACGRCQLPRVSQRSIDEGGSQKWGRNDDFHTMEKKGY